MTARLTALSDYPVDAEFDCRRREFGRGGLHPHADTRGTQCVDPAAGRRVMVKNDQGHTVLHAHVDMPVRTGWPEPGIGADEVDAERSRSQGAQSFHHYGQAVRRIGGCSQDAQTTRIGYRGGEPFVRDEPHTCADERMPEAVLAGQPGREGCDTTGHEFSFDILRFGVYRRIVRIGVLSTRGEQAADPDVLRDTRVALDPAVYVI